MKRHDLSFQYLLFLFPHIIGTFFVTFAAFFLLPIANFAFADECNDLLEANLFNESQIINESAGKSAHYFRACQMSFQEARNSGIFSAGGNYKLFSADVYKNQSSYNTWKSQNCRNIKNAHAQTSFQFMAQKAIASDVVEGWRDCMLRREGLSCFASPSSTDETFSVTVNWRMSSPNLPKVASSFIVNGNVLGGDDKGVFIEKGDTILSNDTMYLIKRDNKEKPTQIVLNISHEEFTSYSCEVFAPTLSSTVEDHDDDHIQIIDEIKQIVLEINTSAPLVLPVRAGVPRCSRLKMEINAIRGSLPTPRDIHTAFSAGSPDNISKKNRWNTRLQAIKTELNKVLSEARQLKCFPGL